MDTPRGRINMVTRGTAEVDSDGRVVVASVTVLLQAPSPEQLLDRLAAIEQAAAEQG